MEKLKILILINDFTKKWPKERYLSDVFFELKKMCTVRYWYKPGDIRDILNKIEFKPDFIFHFDISWNYKYAPVITGLSKIDIPKGCYVIDIHYNKEVRKQYFDNNKIDLIFSTYKEPFLKTFPNYEDKFRWMPYSINTQIMKDWKLNKTIDFLLLGQFYFENKNKSAGRIPPKGRYSFREAVYNSLKDKKGFVFHPHPGHFAPPSKDLIINENYSKEINRSKIFFTCGGIFDYAVAKFFEAPACRTLLLAKPNKDILELGFKDGKNFVACDENDFYDKAMYYVTNNKERNRITDNGYNFILNNHTNKIRAKQFIRYIENYLY